MTEPGAFVIFGATGDLSRRMLLPSLYFLDADGLLPPSLKVIGAGRSSHSDQEFIAQAEEAVRERAGKDFSPDAWRTFAERLAYCGGDAADPKTFECLKSRIGEGRGESLFYLSTSPALYTPIVRGLAAQGLTAEPNRVIVEKPIGKSRATCEEINSAIAEHFSEQRIFRIDHYLGKETVQNLIALRFGNALFEPLWNRHAIDHVQISVAETVGVEGRFDYYNEYGATRDMVQNHLLQLLCLIAMEPPTNLRPESVRSEKVKVLRSLRPLKDAELAGRTVRGQYTRGSIEGEPVPAYADEGGGKPSDTETFVQFRDVPHSIFGDSSLLANRLTIRLQPQEEISLSIMNKTPTLTQGGYELQPLSLNLSLSDAFSGQTRRRIAYERLLLEAISNNSTLFVRRDEAEAAWLWIDRIIEGWSRTGIRPSPYPAGSWGPAGAFALTERNGHSWYE
jgi:glucose-6-phosphate 1-dehydrogenase